MPNWDEIRAEYIAGGISQRSIAKKYGISEATLMKRAHIEKWATLREDAVNKGIALAQQKAADISAESAKIAARIRQKMLRRLEREIDALPDSVGSEMRQSVSERVYDDNNKGRLDKVKDISKAYSLYDLAQAYIKLTGDMVTDGGAEVPDDGFIKALEGSAGEDWNDESSSV